jgi:hypothetical protein
VIPVRQAGQTGQSAVDHPILHQLNIAPDAGAITGALPSVASRRRGRWPSRRAS